MARREVEVYGEWVDHPPDKKPWTCGSGLLLGGRLVLTAAHVVCPAREPLAVVLVRGEHGEHAATVSWRRWEDEVDVALLEITDPKWTPPGWVRWGWLVTDRQRCEAVGFPEVVATPRRRDIHHARGTINPKSLGKAGLLAMEVTNPPGSTAPNRSWWTGMCGTAMRCQGLVVGVVTEDPKGFDSRRLVGVPITTVCGDPDFAALVTKHGGPGPVPEPVELVGLAEPVPAATSPAGLLHAQLPRTPFRARPELDELHRWCADPPGSAIRLVVGPAGQGKTRLAHQLVTELAGHGWATVMLAHTAEVEQIGVLERVRVPTLVVVDYAEARGEQLEAILAAFHRAEAHRAETKVRLLLLARTAGAWRTDYLKPSTLLQPLADDRIVIHLSPLEPEPDGRTHAWGQAVLGLAEGLRDLDYRQPGDDGVDGRRVDWPARAATLPSPSLDGPGFRTILAVQMHALATLLEAENLIAGVNGVDDAQKILLLHEQHYWQRIARGFTLPVAHAMWRCLVVTATLWGAADIGQARALLGAVLPDTRHDERAAVDDWLSALYRDGQRHWVGLQPDRLAEHLIATALSHPGHCDDMPAAAAAVATAEQLEQALTVLGRATPTHPSLARTITDIVTAAGQAGALAALVVAPRSDHQPLLDAVRSFTATADIPTLTALADALPDDSILLSRISVTITETLVARRRTAARTDPDTHLPSLAKWVDTLGTRLAKAGQLNEGLAAAREAVRLSRQLAENDRDAHLLLLVSSLSNVAIRLVETGQKKEGLTAAREAVELSRQLAENDRDAHLPDLGISANDLTIVLTASFAILTNWPPWSLRTGRLTEVSATANLKEFVDLYRRLAEDDPDAHLSGREKSVAAHAFQLGAMGRWEEGLAASQKAVELSRRLAENDRDAYLPDLAAAVIDLGGLLAAAGRGGEALTAAQEAVELCRELTKADRDAYLHRLAMALLSLADRLAETGQREKALAANEETVKLYRELVAINRTVHLPYLAMSLDVLAEWLDEAGQREDALAAAEEAVELCRELAEADRDAYLPALAATLLSLADRLDEPDQLEEAVAAAQEAVKLYREVVARDRAYLPRLAKAWLELAYRYRTDEPGQLEEAIAAARKAVQSHRELTEADRETYLPALAASLHCLANRLGEPDQLEEAVVAAREAEWLFRELAETDRDTYLPLLEKAMLTLIYRRGMLISWLGMEGRTKEALLLTSEAVLGRYNAYPTAVISSVRNLASWLGETRRRVGRAHRRPRDHK